MFRVFSLVALIACLVCTTAFAGGSGNCVQPLKATTDHYGAGVSFGYNYVGSRMMDLYNYGRDAKNVNVSKVSQVYGQIPVGLNDSSNLYLKVGAADYDLKYKDKDNSDETVKVKLDPGIYVGGGYRAVIPMEDWKMGQLSFGIGYDLQMNAFLNKVKGVETDAGAASNEDGDLYGLDGEESIYITCTYKAEKLNTTFVPYLGVYHSWFAIGTLQELKYTRSGASTETTGDIQGAFDTLSFGLLLGLDIEITKYCCLNVEGRLIGENAITTGATLKF
ncbi:MAG: hypothetical protein JW994_07645 [Candidatus Omnitrophica bacterium]|nr:hypothetical protein [Candidatus Omnitrophota bacterium]